MDRVWVIPGPEAWACFLSIRTMEKELFGYTGTTNHQWG